MTARVERRSQSRRRNDDDDDDDDDDDEINKHWPALTEFYRVLFARPSICQPISDAETRLQRPTAEGKV